MLPESLSNDIIKWIISSEHETPAFYYSEDIINVGIKKLKEELGAKISFSTKANSHPMVLKTLVELVDEFNVTNISDLDRLLSLNVDPGRISWIHPVISLKTLERVLSTGVRRFVIDDERGLALLSSVAKELAITLRLRPPGLVASERSVVRFGNSSDILVDLARKTLDAGQQIEALSFFVGVVGSGIDECEPFTLGIEELANLYTKLQKQGITVQTINIGGGFPGSRRHFHREYPDFFRHISGTIQQAFGSDITILCEPGRYVVEPCMLMACKVISDRELCGKRMVYLEASAYGGLFETSFIDPDDHLVLGICANGELRSADLLGPIMDSFDVIKRGCSLPLLEAGDLLLVANVGAYSIGYSNQAEGIKTPQVIKMPDGLSSALSDVWYK